jgi:6-phosphogluconolactonase
MSANDPPAADLPPGAGPRHFTFHPNGRFVFVINEIQSTITSFRYDPERGAFEQIETVSTLPPDYTGRNSTADVHVHPSGRFLYGSNRGHDSIAAYAIDEQTGKLTRIGIQGTGIREPRNFAIDPTGAWLLVGNQGSDSIIVFRIDGATGMLAPTPERVEIGKPVCLAFAPKL